MEPFKPYTDKAKIGWRAVTVREISERIRKYNRLINGSLIAVSGLLFLIPAFNKFPDTLLTGLSIGFGVGLVLFLAVKLLLQNGYYKYRQERYSSRYIQSRSVLC